MLGLTVSIQYYRVTVAEDIQTHRHTTTAYTALASISCVTGCYNLLEFLQHDAMLARYALSSCVCVSVTRQYCLQFSDAKHLGEI